MDYAALSAVLPGRIVQVAAGMSNSRCNATTLCTSGSRSPSIQRTTVDLSTPTRFDISSRLSGTSRRRLAPSEYTGPRFFRSTIMFCKLVDVPTSVKPHLLAKLSREVLRARRFHTHAVSL